MKPIDLPGVRGETSPDKSSAWLAHVLAFLNSIGIDAEIGDGRGGFVAGVLIEEGRLIVCPDARPSNVLHEAGHLSIIPARFRPLASGKLAKAFEAMAQGVDWSNPESEDAVAAMQCSDPEATAWAWAAGIHLGMPEELIIADDEYDGEGAGIRLGLRLNSYLGINGLSRAGWCVVRPGALEAIRGLPAYPKLCRWTQA